MYSVATVQLAPGDRIGQYEILRPLGAGGMGEVYCARDEKLGREVALKILPGEASERTEAMRRFETEARAASALNHPNIITIYEINQADAFAWIAMELVDGDDLRTILQREPLTVKSALRIATRVADGLAVAHERGIVHRDLKPDNVMVTPEGFVKILDFGLAKHLRVFAAEDTTLPHTSPGTIFGTVAYMSPEQAMGREMDACSDQFSFGVMLYEMLTRQRPFERESRMETLAAILRDEPRPPSEINPEISRELDRIVLRCLAKKPRERYASTRDLARDLRELRDGLSETSAPRHTVPRQTHDHRRLFRAVAVLAAVLIATGAYLMWKRRDAVRRITSVAVVPFRDLDGTAEGHVFADGISEMVATRLAQARELRVATPFTGAPIREGDDVREIARRTGAGGVVRGTVQRVGGDVRVTASLIDARSGSTLAATALTRPANDLFALQDAVADELLSVLGRPLAGTPPVAAAAVLGAEDQRRFTEAVGLLQRVRDEHSVDRAIASLESILRNSRQSGPVNALLARALLYKSSLARRPALIEQATVYATRGVALSGNDPESHITLGQLQNASGRHEDAVKSFERALALRPQSPGAFLGLADAYNGEGRGAEAEKMYQKVLAMRPDETGAMSRYGSFCYRRGRYEEAARYFRRAAELQPELAQAHANLGGALQALGRYDEALASYQRSLAVEPTAAGYSNLGTLQFSLGRYDAARESYERAARLAPSDPVIWANLGDACRWSPAGRDRANETYARAIAAGRDALESNPNDAYMRSVVAASLAKSGRAEEGHDEIRRALEIDPTNASVLYKAAVIALIRGNSDSAISWIERAVANGYPAAEVSRDPELAAIRHLPPLGKGLESQTK